MLLNLVIFLGSAALGLWVTSLVLADFEVQATGFVVAVVIFAVAQLILSPFIFKMTLRYASALQGGVGLVSTFVALLLASVLTDGLIIRGVDTWVIGTLLVWLITALATWLLPLWILKNRVADRKATSDRRAR